MVRAPQNGRHSFYCSRAGGQNLGSGCLAEIVRREFDGMNFVPKKFRLFFFTGWWWIIFDKWLVNNDEQPFPRRCFSFFWKKRNFHIAAVLGLPAKIFSTHRVEELDESEIAACAGHGPIHCPWSLWRPVVGRCFFSKTACKKRRKMVQDFWWNCLLFKMFVNLARPFFFFLKTSAKKDGSKDYPQRLQSCENYWSFGRLLLWVIMNHIFSDKGCSETHWNLHVWWWSIFKNERHICM